MMRDEWEGPDVWKPIVKMGLAMLVPGLIFLTFFPFPIKSLVLLVTLVSLFYVTLAIGMMYGPEGYGRLYRSKRRPLPMGLEDARRYLEQGLADSGLPHGEKTDYPSGPKFIIWDIRSGLEVRLAEQKTQCYVWVGPVNDSTRRDVDALARAIDAALQRAKR
jgi:hypothetical protein